MLVEVSVVPSSPSFSLARKGNIIKIFLTEKAEGNRANIELIKELERLTKARVQIVSGAKSRRKKIAIDISENEWEEILRRFENK